MNGSNSANTRLSSRFGARADLGSARLLVQTRRRLRGRQPLCGIGVTSRIEVTLTPAAWIARRADSRPEPGPETSTSSVRMPCSAALRTASSAAICAANGVDLREPLNPIVPAEDHEIVLPCASVMVIIVLLNVEFTWATPVAMFLRSRRRTRVASLAMSWSFNHAFARQFLNGLNELASLLLAGDRLGLALAGARVGVRALTADRQLPPVAEASIGPEVHQALDVDRDLAAKIAFHHIVAIDGLADLHHIGVAQLGDAALGRDIHLLANLLGLLRPDPVNVLERDDDALVGWNIDACYASHSLNSPFQRRFLREAKAPRAKTDSASGGGRPLPRTHKTQKVPCARNGAGTQNVFGMAGI